MKKRQGLCFSLCKNKKGGDVVAQQPNRLSPRLSLRKEGLWNCASLGLEFYDSCLSAWSPERRVRSQRRVRFLAEGTTQARRNPVETPDELL